MRLRIDLAYHGAEFHGWAAQPGLRTVEGEVTAAMATALRVPSVELTCAGRTDTGVHARGQVAHCDLAQDPGDLAVLTRRLNGILPPDVRVRAVAEAPDGFDARFAALWRRYAYRVADSQLALDPITRGHVLFWPRPLDVAAMEGASSALVGEHDFAAFCRRREGATTVRTLLQLSWRRGEDGLVVADVRADAFCHSMVRSLVGCLLAVGDGRQPVEWPARVLEGQHRDSAVTVAPAHALVLEAVAYPPPDELAARVTMTRARRNG
jgi:tRNA pseudouridine38-40 synthase